jgi:hypothetical protein
MMLFCDGSQRRLAYDLSLSCRLIAQAGGRARMARMPPNSERNFNAKSQWPAGKECVAIQRCAAPTL